MDPEPYNETLRTAIADARLADVDVDVTPLAHLDAMDDDTAVDAIDDVYRAIMLDGLGT
ncbi:hypothetical protein GCM10010156_49530 [Planobispora rosea]|uniref:Uncharacterized protein n=1 Tax=Planobispora rosea TaxID=35762 RepID=A0A8J3WDZ7_PLARO|nr:hypothetical protein [Planobispora rosea]GGS85013.1 hypothetical protein GCM10010156_49530 [Planobispora rosea]GIH86464.1 hypothetical protein Pro02_48720 [Planobispora rosea]